VKEKRGQDIIDTTSMSCGT